MRFAKIPAILSTVLGLNWVSICKQLRENIETMSIAKPQINNLPVFWLAHFIIFW